MRQRAHLLLRNHQWGSSYGAAPSGCSHAVYTLIQIDGSGQRERTGGIGFIANQANVRAAGTRPDDHDKHGLVGDKTGPDEGCIASRLHRASRQTAADARNG